MELWVGALIVLGLVLLAVVRRTTGDPSRVISGMWRYRAPDWPTGVQEDDEAQWSWSKAAGRPDPSHEAGDGRDRPEPDDEGLTVDVAPIGYEVRSSDRARS